MGLALGTWALWGGISSRQQKVGPGVELRMGSCRESWMVTTSGMREDPGHTLGDGTGSLRGVTVWSRRGG